MYLVTHQPSFAGLQTDCAVAVHGGLEELLRAQVPEEHDADAGPDGEDVALERHRPDAAPAIARRNLLHGLWEVA